MGWQDGPVVDAGDAREPSHPIELDEIAHGAGPDGVVWALGGPRQLEANLVVLSPHGSVGEHHNREVDVLVVVLEGDGHLDVDGVGHPLRSHCIVLVPRGAARSITAGRDGLRYLSIHRTRNPVSIGRARS